MPGEQVLTSTLEHVAADAARHAVRPPAVVVIGHVVGLRDQLCAGLAGELSGEADDAGSEASRIQRGAA
jgi:hypothetical protein